MNVLMSESWKTINGYEGSYYVSNAGEVFSVRSAKLLRPSPTEKGYMRVCLQDHGLKEWKRIHRLVAEAFIPNPHQKETVNHINGIRSDNRVENLEWATMQEQNSDDRRRRNMSESMSHSEYVQNKKRRVVQMTTSGQVITTYSSMHEAARALGNPKLAGGIYSCCCGKRKTLHGYCFNYT